jgi:SagB-type dehydrogenase family enzyme
MNQSRKRLLLIKDIEDKIQNMDENQLEKIENWIKLFSSPSPTKYKQEDLLSIHQITRHRYQDFYKKQFQLKRNSKTETKRFKLPEPETQLSTKFTDVIINRRSRRNYIRKSISLPTLSNLLYFTYGPTKSEKSNQGEFVYRTAPSAGALFPIELFIVVQRVNELKPGVYRYLAKDHELELYLSDIDEKDFFQAGMEQSFINDSAVVLLLTAFPNKIFWKYNIRSYRYIYLDAGHIAQNAYLAAEALNIGSCEIGAFFDDYLNSLFQFDEKEAFIVSLITIGVLY